LQTTKTRRIASGGLAMLTRADIDALLDAPFLVNPAMTFTGEEVREMFDLYYEGVKTAKQLVEWLEKILDPAAKCREVYGATKAARKWLEGKP
jgi:hypothetical protein